MLPKPPNKEKKKREPIPTMRPRPDLKPLERMPPLPEAWKRGPSKNSEAVGRKNPSLWKRDKARPLLPPGYPRGNGPLTPSPDR